MLLVVAVLLGQEEVVSRGSGSTHGAAPLRRGSQALGIETPFEQRERRRAVLPPGSPSRDHDGVHVFLRIELRLLQEPGRVPVGRHVIGARERRCRCARSRRQFSCQKSFLEKSQQERVRAARPNSAVEPYTAKRSVTAILWNVPAETSWTVARPSSAVFGKIQ